MTTSNEQQSGTGRRPVALPQMDELFRLNPDTVTPFAALYRISAELRPLALAGLPYGTRCWAEELGLIAGEDDGLYLTEAGQTVAAAAALREPEPYANVSFAELARRPSRRLRSSAMLTRSCGGGAAAAAV